MLQPDAVPETENRLRTHPKNDKPVAQATDELADAPLFLKLKQHADVARRHIRGLAWIIEQRQKEPGRGSGTLRRCKSPGVEIAQVVNVFLRGVLHQSRLIVFHEAAKRASGLAEHLQYRFIIDNFAGPHGMDLAKRTPHHTPIKPRTILKPTYEPAIR